MTGNSRRRVPGDGARRAGAGQGEALLLLGSLLVFLAGAEAVLRLAGWGGSGPTGYAPVDTQLAANRHENRRGYRDEERAIAKPAGVRRVVSLGDSFAWGVGVRFEDAYPHRVERLLCERRQEAWQVVNLALRGMNTVEETAKLEDEGFAYSPDVVLLGYVLNDSEDEHAAETRRAADWLERRSAPEGWLERSRLFRLVTTRVEATLENRRRIEGYRSMYAPDASGWLAGQRSLRRMGALCRGHGVPLVVAIFPLFGNRLDAGYPFAGIHAKVAAAAAAAGAEVVDLLPRYQGLRWELLVVAGPDDEHPNEIAHRIAAGPIARAIAQVVPAAGRGGDLGGGPAPDRGGSRSSARRRG